MGQVTCETPADLLAAVEGARAGCSRADDYGRAFRAHCDDLEATLRRHACDQYGNCDVCGDYWAACGTVFEAMPVAWPCPDVQQVVERLTEFGGWDK